MGKIKPALQLLSPAALSHVHTAEELREFLHTYAQQQWGIPANAPLENIFPLQPELPKHEQDAEFLVAALAGALYAGRAIDIEDLKTRARRLLADLKRPPRSRHRYRGKLPDLNPS